MSASIIQKNILLAPLTSWLVGGPAEFFAQPRTPEELTEVLAWARAENQDWTVLSGGTNILISDQGIKGLTIAMNKFAGAQARVEQVCGHDRLVIECLSGASKSELLKVFLKHKLAPALFLAGLPGDVGGGVAMNAGVGEMLQPREFVEITDWIEVMRPSGEIVKLQACDLSWSYRHCVGWQPGIITRTQLSWPNEPQDDVLAKVREANKARLSKQPLDMPSCGSVFRNPTSHKSGQLIESLGLKGFAVGGAKVSEKHANFIVNFNGATAAEIDAVIKHVQAEVLARAGVRLQTEVVYLGDWPI